MKVRCATLFLLVLGALPVAAHAQISYLWGIEELRARADLVVVAEWIASEDTGRQVDHPDLKPGLPMIEMRTRFKILTILKEHRSSSSIAVDTALQLKHYRFDHERWQREHPGVGLVNAGSVLQFRNEKGPYLLFLKSELNVGYEPLSGHTFPTDSVFLLSKLGKPPG